MLETKDKPAISSKENYSRNERKFTHFPTSPGVLVGQVGQHPPPCRIFLWDRGVTFLHLLGCSLWGRRVDLPPPLMMFFVGQEGGHLPPPLRMIFVG